MIRRAAGERMGKDMGEPYDVVQVGYGPVSEALALMLGNQGRSVAICERWETRYPLPRAVCIDHELYRVLAANGLGAMLPGITQGGPPYQWFNADWRELLVIDWSAPSVSGGPEVNFVHQPTLERALDEAVRALPSIDLDLGWAAVAVRQDDGLAHVDLVHGVTGDRKSLSARYVVGCDGANSIVRETIGGGREDRGFEADWLVIDVLLKDGVTIEQLGIPAAGQYCNPIRPTTIVPAGVREGRVYRRWEFMRLPGEAPEDLEREDRVWELLSPWAGPDHVELVRHKIYNFRSLIAKRWRDRRLLIAGDAAHVMPPFMGQGMCSGLRDGWNLAWKLGLVLDGKAPDTLLDTYQRERMPHVGQLTDISIYLGKMICMPDTEQAAIRDAAFLGGTAPPPPPFPQLTDGLLDRGTSDAIVEGAGVLCPHVELLVDGVRHRLDEVVRIGDIMIVGREDDPSCAIEPDRREALATLGVSYLTLGSPDSGRAVDVEGRLVACLDRYGWTTMIVRPDFYVYGGASDRIGLRELVGRLLGDLAFTEAEPAALNEPQLQETGDEARAI